MRRKHLTLMFAILLLIPLLGCGFKNVLPSKKVPPLDSYSTVALVSANAKPPAEKFADFATMLSYGIGTKSSVRRQNANWIFDQSKQITPVSDKLKELNISQGDVFQDPQAAAKLAESLQADLIVVWETLEDPRFTKEESGKIVEDKSLSTPTGSARYYTINQTAMLKADIKLITKAGEQIWDGRIIGYKKYETLYLTGAPPKEQRLEKMLAEVRKDFVEKLVDKLFPSEAVAGK